MRRAQVVVSITLLCSLGLFVACAEDDEEAGPKTHTDAGKVTNGDATTGTSDGSLIDVNNLADSPAVDTGPKKEGGGPPPVDAGVDGAKKDAAGDAATDTGTDTGGNNDSGGGQDASVDADDDSG
jgi:hypothetical protein